MKFSSLATPFRSAAPLALLALALGGAGAQAQQVFRIVAPDGRVTFSDQPPPQGSEAKVSNALGGRAGIFGAEAALPFELRAIVSRYPVILYTGEGCGPCTSGRSLLNARGIPFTEKTISTNDDTEALRRLSGDNSLPLLTIGGQQIKGFSDIEWGQFLDAAGYPKESVLPAAYRNPPATALVSVRKQEQTAASPAAAPAAPTPAVRVAPPAEPANPSGIRF